MNSLAKTRQRLINRSQSIAVLEEQVNKEDEFQQDTPVFSLHKKFHLSSFNKNYNKSALNLNMNMRRGDNSPTLSPDFAKTQRIDVFSIKDREQLLSQRQSQIDSQVINRKYRSYTINLLRANTPHTPQPLNQLSFVDKLSNKAQLHEIGQSIINRRTVHQNQIQLMIMPAPIRIAQSPVKPKQCVKQYMQRTIQNYKQKGHHDELFPPRFSIIFNQRMKYQQQGLSFQRVSKIFQPVETRLLDSCQPAYLVQGKFTSPAVYSAFTILSQEPTRLLNIFGNQKISIEGIYYLHLCKNGVFRYIIIDDWFPIKQMKSKIPLFLYSHPFNQISQIWPSVLQKALAKIYGTYQDLLLARYTGIRDIMQILTGFPVSEYIVQRNFRSFVVLVDEALKRQQIVVLEDIKTECHQQALYKSLDPYRSYQVIEVRKSSVLLRNLNDPDLVSRFSFQEISIFNRLLIFRNQKSYQYISQNLRHKQGFYSQVEVSIEQDTKCYWDVWENSIGKYKLHLQKDPKYRVNQYQIFIKLNTSSDPIITQQEPPSPLKPKTQINTKYIRNSPQKQSRIHRLTRQQNEDILLTESGIEVELKKGDYIVDVHVCQQREQDFVLSYYGEKNIKMKRLKNMEFWNDQGTGNCKCFLAEKK